MRLWPKVKLEDGQGIAEYAIMGGVILVIVLGLLRLVDTRAFNLLTEVAKAIR